MIWLQKFRKDAFLKTKNELRGAMVKSEGTWVRQTWFKVLFNKCNLLLLSWSPESKNVL